MELQGKICFVVESVDYTAIQQLKLIPINNNEKKKLSSLPQEDRKKNGSWGVFMAENYAKKRGNHAIIQGTLMAEN